MTMLVFCLFIYLFQVVCMTNLKLKFMYISKPYGITLVRWLKLRKEIIKTWKSGRGSSTNIVIPKYFVNQYHLDSSHILVENRPELNGILIRKLEVGDII